MAFQRANLDAEKPQTGQDYKSKTMAYRHIVGSRWSRADFELSAVLGLKILVSVVRFRPRAPFNSLTDRAISSACGLGIVAPVGRGVRDLPGAGAIRKR